MAFKIVIETDAKLDIQEGIDYYNECQKGLGQKFHKQVKQYFNALKKNPFYQVRYDNVRCLPLKKYPYMIHFSVDEKQKTVTIWAVFETHQHPNKYPKT